MAENPTLAEDEAPTPAVTSSQSASLTIPLIIELGRIPMTLQQVGQINNGQVLQLTQTSKDPVNLVIGDKIVGQGELLEIEGKLGVKILALSGL